MSDIKEGTVLTIDSSATLTRQQYLMSLMHLGTLSKCIALMVENQIANSLSSKEDAVCVSDLARCLQLDEENLRRVLSFLASYGMVDELEGGRFRGTPLSDVLRDDHEDSVAEMIRHLDRRQVQLALVDIGYSLKTGKASFEHVHGSPFYKYLNDHPYMERTFDHAIAQASGKFQDKLVSTYDFSRYNRIADIAGGRGGLLLKIMNRWENVSGTLFERSIALANRFKELDQFENRFNAVEGDALEEINTEADLFIIANTLTNYDDTGVEKILKNVGKAMAKSQKEQQASRLLVIEPDFGDLEPNEPATLTRGLDLLMMYLLGGKMRNEREWRSFLTSKGDIEILNTFKVPPFHCAFECKHT